MPDNSTQIILTEMRDLRTRMDQWFDAQDEKITEQGERIAELATQMKSLVGNGQPGRVQKLEDEVKDLKRYKTMLWTGIMMIGGLLSALVYRGYEIFRWLGSGSH